MTLVGSFRATNHLSARALDVSARTEGHLDRGFSSTARRCRPNPRTWASVPPTGHAIGMRLTAYAHDLKKECLPHETVDLTSSKGRISIPSGTHSGRRQNVNNMDRLGKQDIGVNLPEQWDRAEMDFTQIY